MTKTLYDDHPTIEEKVAFLSNPGSYPLQSEQVDVVETHMSWVFLVGTRVYKLKKPVLRERFDLRGIDRRYQNAVDEIRLNRRLGGETYIGLGRLGAMPHGRLVLGEEGVAVDWLVVMHRLPQADMLDRQIEARAVNYDRLAEAAARLARFYQSADRIAIQPAHYRGQLRASVQNDAQQLLDYGVSAEPVLRARDQQMAFLDRSPSPVARRASQKRIVEGHGDLRPEHVGLTAPPVIIDCLEFSRELRILDPVDELALLAMECERLGNERVGEIVFDVYRKVSGDQPESSLVAFYKAHRACQRAKLAIWHLDDDRGERRGPWRRRTEAYLESACRYGCGF